MQQIETSLEPADNDAPLRVSVRSIGPTAYQALANKPVHPFARFDRCAYVASPDGQVACIGDASIGDGPLNAILEPSGEFERVLQSSATPTIEADVSRARQWKPHSRHACANTHVSASALTELRRALDVFQLDRGLSPLLVPLLDGDNPTAPMPLLLDNAWPGVSALRDWLRMGAGGIRSVPNEVLTLIGLGPGLTPSGDDVLGGCLVTLRAMGRLNPAARLGHSVLEAARDGTGRISQAHLGCAVDGYGGAALHDIVDATLTGETHDFPAQLSALDRIGHSSGWDALVGVVLSIGAGDR